MTQQVDAGAVSDVELANGHAQNDHDDDPLSSSDEQEQANEDDAMQDVVGFGDALHKLLTQHVADDVQPILAKRMTARMREIQSDRKETKTARLSAAEKREREHKDLVLPDHSTAGQDRQLRTIATKGVVALFNAIEKHQHQLNGKLAATKNDKKVKELSKANFLGLLKASQQQTTATPVPKTTSSWSVVQDDFMMEAKLKDWDNQHGTEVGRVQQKGDADVEAVEDIAWHQAQDTLDRDHEAPSERETTHNSTRRAFVPVKKTQSSKKRKHS